MKMKIACKECHIELSKELVELSDKKLICENDGNDFLPIGLIFTSDGEFFIGSEQKLIINLKDLINSKNHPDKVCANGHEIGTAKDDCWMPHCMILEPELIEIK